MKNGEIDKIKREHSSQTEALTAKLNTCLDEAKSLREQIDEVQGLYDYQLGINDSLNAQVESLNDQVSILQGEKELLLVKTAVVTSS